MRVLVTGASGFVGRAVVRTLVAGGHQVRAVVRHPGAPSPSVEWRAGDVTRPETLQGLADGQEALIHLVGIIRPVPRLGQTFERVHEGGTAHVAALAAAAGVRRLVHMSALGADTGDSAYHRTKRGGEEIVRRSGLDWTIFRPSIIYGPGDGFVNLLADLVRRAPLVPVIGHGRYPLQPVAVEDVAAAFTRALEMPETIGQTYEAGGPERIDYVDLLRLVAELLGRPFRPVHLPAGIVRALLPALERLPGFPLTSDQLSMLFQGNACDPEPFLRRFDLRPRPLRQGLAAYVHPR